VKNLNFQGSFSHVLDVISSKKAHSCTGCDKTYRMVMRLTHKNEDFKFWMLLVDAEWLDAANVRTEVCVLGIRKITTHMKKKDRTSFHFSSLFFTCATPLINSSCSPASD
jgi:hypothetical protein